MRPLLVISALVLSAPALAAGGMAAKNLEKKQEALGLVNAIIQGTNVNVSVSRIQFLGEEELASVELGGVLPRAWPVERRRVVAQALATLANRAAEVPMIAALRDADAPVRMAAAQGLGRMRSSAAGPALIPLLTDKTVGVRREAARAIGLCKAARAGGPLIAAAKVEDDPDTRAVMLAAVGPIGDKAQIPALEGFLAGSSESARFGSAQSLCLLGSAKGFAFARELLKSPDRYERMQGLMLFDGASAKLASPVLAPMLADPDARVQARAARLLFQGGDLSKLDWLVVKSFSVVGEARLPYETELELLRLSDEQRKVILRKAGLIP